MTTPRPNRAPLPRLIALACILSAPVLLSPMIPGAAAQSQAREGELRRVEPGVGDVGPLGISLRSLSQNLAVPVDFEDVRQDPRRSDQLVRSSGALHAVFPRSWYAETATGAVALVPPGTIFRIGSESLDRALQTDGAFGPPGRSPSNAWTAGASGMQDVNSPYGAAPLATTGRFLVRQDLPDVPRHDIELDGARYGGAIGAEDAAPRIVVDETYRRQRLTALRDRVLDAHAARGRSSSSSK